MSPKDFTKKMNLQVPLVVAPMAGGFSTPEFISASCNAGALGFIGAAYSTAADIQKISDQVRAKTSKPFGINLFVSHEPPKVSASELEFAIQSTKSFRDELGLPAPTLNLPYEENFDQQFEVMLKIKPAVFSFVFGVLQPEYLKAAKAQGIYLMGTATTLGEALALQESGVDAVILQGLEAGGHRALFDSKVADPEMTLLDLLACCRSQIKIPLIASGGIMNSADIQGVLKKGASAVHMGTAFLTCQEAGTSAPYRRALLNSAGRKTKTTRAFSGRLARGIENRFMHALDAQPGAIMPFPAQNKFTRDIRGASGKADVSDFLSLWAGTGSGELWTGSVEDLIKNLFTDVEF